MGETSWRTRCPMGHVDVTPRPQADHDYYCKSCAQYDCWPTDGRYDAEEIEEVAG